MTLEQFGYDASATMPMRPRALRVADFCRVYGIGKSKAWELIAAGELQSVMLAGRRLILVDSAETLLRKAAARDE